MTYYRRLPKFDYLAPKSVREVLSLLRQHTGSARLFAGGTIALQQMKDRIAVRPFVIGLKGVAGLDTVGFDKRKGLEIGSMALLQSIADSPDVNARCPLLTTVCGMLGTPQIRNMGTIGGNVAVRFSTSETIPALIAVKAEAVLVTEAGERAVQVEGLHKEMKGDDLLIGFRVPPSAQGTRTGYKKFAMRERFDYATVSASVAITMDGKTCKDITIGLGGVTLPTMRAKSAEELMKGHPVTAALVEKAADEAAKEGHTGADVMFTAEYKTKVLKTMVERAIKEAAGV